MSPTRKGLFVVSILYNVFMIAFFALIYSFTREDTVYAPAYSDSAFASIACGMTSKDVLKLLGEPLRVVVNKPSSSRKVYDFQEFSFLDSDSANSTEGLMEEVVWYYSEQGPNKSHYLIRDVVFDPLGNLRRKIKSSYYD